MSRPRNTPEGYSGFAFGPFRLDVSRQILWRQNERIALGHRSFGILCALLERPGQLISKTELFSRVWPDISVDEANLRVQVGILRKALGEYGANIIAATGLGYQFVGNVASHSRPVGLQRRRLKAPVGIDQPLGREEDIASTIHHLKARRLVSIVGPGGIGKTTLALAVAGSLESSYQDGVCFADLGLVSDAALVTAALASALRRPINEDSLEALLIYLQSLDLLLILDCCEHVVDTVAQIAEAVLKAASGVHILATSREALRAQDELVLELGALKTPSSAGPLTATEATGFSAIRLFARCATSSAKDFKVTDENAGAIADVCRRLDGIPLAIELAAALVGFLGLSAVRDGLDRRFAVLTLNRRTSLARHRTLAATMDWSYELLSDSERAVLRRLSVFAGKFEINAAVEVSSFGEVDTAEAASTIIDLANKSLVSVDRRGGVPEYRLLETTRVYARQQTALHGEREQSALKHARHYLSFLENFDWESYDPHEERNTVADCIEEVRVALDWAYNVAEDQGVAVNLTVAAERLWLELALVPECIQRTQQALERLQHWPKPEPRLRMKLLTALCAAQISAYSPELDPSLLEEALSIADRFEDRGYQIRSLWGLTHCGMLARQAHQALVYARRLQALAVERPGQPEVQLSDHLLGWAHFGAGDLIEARKYLERFLKEYTSPPRFHAVLFGFAKHVTAKIALAMVMWLQGLPERALALVEEGLAEAERMQHGATTLYALGFGACSIALFTRNLGAGRRHLSALNNAVHIYKRWEKLAIAYKGMVARQDGDLSLALECLSVALTGHSPAKAGTLYPRLLLELAAVRCSAGDFEGSEVAVELAWQCRSGPEDVYVVCETLRVKAEVMRSRDGDGSVQQAEALLVEAIRVARTQRALTLELASATALAQLRISDGRRDEATRLLGQVVAQFTEGFDLSPLLQARALL
jgi:predicted ATPase/DNA-binding winged helix-turn-helix (wHTH) protein